MAALAALPLAEHDEHRDTVLLPPHTEEDAATHPPAACAASDANGSAVEPAQEQKKSKCEPESQPPEPPAEKQQQQQRSPKRVKTHKRGINPLNFPPSDRFGIIEEHERHKERLDAISSGRSVSQSTVLSRSSTRLSKNGPTRSPRNLDPVTQTMMENHKKALMRINADNNRAPITHAVNWKRWGNTHAHDEEFVDPRHPESEPSARDRRLHNNSYRNGRLIAAERVDEDNARFVASLIHARPVVQTTATLLQQERERQSWLRRIERGPTVSPRNVSSEDVHHRELKWDNHVNPFLPKPPPVGSVIANHDASKPKVLWEEKMHQARELERLRLQQAVEQSAAAAESSGQGESRQPSPTLSPRSQQQTKPKKVTRSKPAAASLAECMEKAPAVDSGRHAGHPRPPAQAKSKGHSARDKQGDAQEAESPPRDTSSAHKSEDEHPAEPEKHEEHQPHGPSASSHATDHNEAKPHEEHDVSAKQEVDEQPQHTSAPADAAPSHHDHRKHKEEKKEEEGDPYEEL